MKKHVVTGGQALLANAYVQGLSVVNRRSSSCMTLALAAAVVVAFPHLAEAQTVGGSDPAAMIKNIASFILGGFGQSLALLGIVGIGLSWMFGRASMGIVAGVIGGIIIMFGASFLANQLTGAAGG